MEKLLDDLVYEANHTHDTATILADAIFAIILALIELAIHYTREVILSAELRHELQDIAQFHSDYRFLKDDGLHSVSDLGKEIQRTEAEIAVLVERRNRVRNRVRQETDPQVLADNRSEREKITSQIKPLRQRINRFERIQRDTSRLLNLLKTELQAKFAVKHPIKEQQKQRVRSYEQER